MNITLNCEANTVAPYKGEKLYRVMIIINDGFSHENRLHSQRKKNRLKFHDLARSDSGR